MFENCPSGFLQNRDRKFRISLAGARLLKRAGAILFERLPRSEGPLLKRRDGFRKPLPDHNTAPIYAQDIDNALFDLGRNFVGRFTVTQNNHNLTWENPILAVGNTPCGNIAPLVCIDQPLARPQP
jgi:hypothetical protein